MSAKRLLRPWLRGPWTDTWLAVGVSTLAIVAAFAVALHFVKPAPPRRLVLAVGRDEAGEAYFANLYKKNLATYGVDVEVRESAGTVENLRLLASGASGIDAALVVGGALDPASHADVLSLGSLSYAPLWVFYRGDPIDDPGALRGRRIAVGPPGSAMRQLAEQLLAINGSAAPPTVLLSDERDEALAALRDGRIDAMFVLSPARAPFLRTAAATPGVRLLGFARADAYARRYPFLTRVELPRGILDLAHDVPPGDVVMPAPTVNLLVRRQLHPALAYILLRAASAIHHRGNWLDRADEFPAPRDYTLGATGAASDGEVIPLSDEAARYYRAGVPWLQRFLPFWLANLVDRLWVMLIPVLAVVIPVGQLVPRLYAWRMRARIHRWYVALKTFEVEFDGTDGHALAAMLARLDDLDATVRRTPMPRAWNESLFTFRGHVSLLRDRVLRRMERDAAQGRAA